MDHSLLTFIYFKFSDLVWIKRHCPLSYLGGSLSGGTISRSAIDVLGCSMEGSNGVKLKNNKWVLIAVEQFTLPHLTDPDINA